MIKDVSRLLIRLKHRNQRSNKTISWTEKTNKINDEGVKWLVKHIGEMKHLIQLDLNLEW